MIKKWWDKISFLGLEDLEKNDALFRFREVILINRLIFVLSIIMILFIPFELIVHGTDLVLIIIIEILLIWVTLILNKHRLFHWARLYMFFMSILVVGPLLFFVPKEANNQYLMLPLSLIPVVLFKRKSAVIGGFVFVVVTFFFIEHTRDLVPDIVDIPSETVHIFADAFILMVFSILFLLLYYFKAVNTDYETIIGERNADLKKSHEIISEKNKEITDSITYAKRLQEAILPPEHFIKTHLPESFIFYKPKDIVAGDFYWMELASVAEVVTEPSRSTLEAQKREKTLISGTSTSSVSDIILFAAADCTGHGVPGAMVSVVCHNALNRSVKEFGLTEPGKILDKTKELVVETFTKSNNDVKDGMDISLCSIKYQVESIKTEEKPKVNAIIQWAGANNPLWVVRSVTSRASVTDSQYSLQEFKADKQPIGKTDLEKPFTTHSLELQKGDLVYLFTDGFADQFGGEKGKKFMYKPLKELLLKNADLPMEQQKELLQEAFLKWTNTAHHTFEQVDDVCIVGIKIGF